MGCFGSKDRLSKEDMDFLKTHTRYDETTIKEWYKGFKVRNDSMETFYEHCDEISFFFYQFFFSSNIARLS